MADLKALYRTQMASVPKFTGILLICVLIFIGCKSQKPLKELINSEQLKIEKLTDNLFLHVSYLDTQEYGKVACNGLVYVKNNEAIIFDTPTNDLASEELINWIGNKSITAVIPTHFHIDCLGGLEEFHKNGIDSYANDLTITLASKNENVLPKNGFNKKLELEVGDEKVLIQFFGQGHTADNVVAYIPSEKALFGGCLIKSLGSGKGNLADANVKEWPVSVNNIKNEYPEIKWVVPGHGKSGGIELLDYTINLFTLNN